MKVQELFETLNESKANVDHAIAYLKALGLTVEKEPVENKDNKIVFKVVGKSGKQVIGILDKQSDDIDLDEDDPKNKKKKLVIGQGWDSDKVPGAMDMEYADKSGSDWSRSLSVINVSKTECHVELDHRA